MQLFHFSPRSSSPDVETSRTNPALAASWCRPAPERALRLRRVPARRTVLVVAMCVVGIVGCASPRLCNPPVSAAPIVFEQAAVVTSAPLPPVPSRMMATVRFESRYSGAFLPDHDSTVLLETLSANLRQSDLQVSRILLIGFVPNLGRLDADWVRAMRRTEAVRQVLERNGVDPLLVQADQRRAAAPGAEDGMVRPCLRWVKHRCQRVGRAVAPAKVLVVVDGQRPGSPKT